uniref:AAA+ ATPase domain-containing protein n=1 Tax=Paramoeba aestuarina TaxID=180227 RepID=A0A7S4PAP3_9EUKA|mmetsp:Transcript_39057/g.61826  ORF Transcript_39057/g.61826 Transcript_39057/m.61826 type:complete len:494 (+) Transcript_39057:3-1484(+)
MWYAIPAILAFSLARKIFVSSKLTGVADIFSPVSSRNFRVDVSGTKFSDVIGIDEAREEVKQYFQYLKSSRRFQNLGAHMPKGCLLTGEPGTGKTLIAKAIASEAGVPFFSANGSDFCEIYGGSGSRRVRELFQQAREVMPSVIFIDEIDALGSRYTTKNTGGSGEENRTMNQLLSEIDGVSQSTSDKILIFAATNIKNALDPALLREGRFDRKVHIDLPDHCARTELFNHFLQKHKQSVLNDTCEKLANLTPGISPAAISTIVNEASIMSSEKMDSSIKFETLVNAIEDITLGKKKDCQEKAGNLEREAYYHAGKALVSWFLPLKNQMRGELLKLSIATRGNTSGYCFRQGREAHEYDTDIKIFNEVCQLLAGKIAEKTIFGNSITKNSVQDVRRASRLCLQGLLSFGFQAEMGRVSTNYNDIGHGQIFISSSARRQEESELRANEVLSQAAHISAHILRTRSCYLKKLVSELLKRKELSHADLTRVLGKRH